MADTPKIGEVFNPWPEACGFHPGDAVMREPDRNLDAGAKLLYLRLLKYAGRDALCFPKVETLARDLGVTEKAIDKRLARLHRHGLISHKRRAGRRSNTYQFLWHKMFELEGNAGSRQTGQEPNRSSPHDGNSGGGLKGTPGEFDGNASTHEAFQESSSGSHSLKPPPSPPGGAGAVPGKGKADDEKTWESPESEFRRRIKERHGERVDVLDLHGQIRALLDPWGIGLDELLRLDAEKTTHPGGLTNPVGYYLSLANSLTAKARGRFFNNDRRLQRDIEEQARRGGNGQRCSRCSAGRVGEGYCSCKMGCDLRPAEQKGGGVARAPEAAQKQAAILAPVLEAGAH